MQARNSHSKMPINGGDLKAGMDLILRGKKNYTLSAQRLISQYGDERIVGIQVCREPIKLSKIVEKLKLLRKKPVMVRPQNSKFTFAKEVCLNRVIQIFQISSTPCWGYLKYPQHPVEDI